MKATNSAVVSGSRGRTQKKKRKEKSRGEEEEKRPEKKEEKGGHVLLTWPFFNWQMSALVPEFHGLNFFYINNI